MAFSLLILIGVLSSLSSIISLPHSLLPLARPVEVEMGHDKPLGQGKWNIWQARLIG